MMDLGTIRELSRSAGRRARRNGNEPKVYTAADLERARNGDIKAVAGIPNLGTYLPKGWARVSLEAEAGTAGVYMGDNDGYGAYFVDKGWGGDDGITLSVQKLAERMKPGLGYAMVEEGQFQVKVGAFAVVTAGLRNGRPK